MHSVMISKRFFDDGLIATLPSGGKLLYLGLLLRRGDEDNTFIDGSGDLEDTSFVASKDLLLRYAGGSGHVVDRLLDQLQSFQLLRYEKTTPNRIEKNRKERKRIEKKVIEGEIKSSDSDSNENSDQPVFSPETGLLRIYADLYPLKKGKSKGLQALMRQIKTENDLLDFEKAVVKYKLDIEKNRTSQEYIKHFSTFANSWRDWLDDDAGKSTVQAHRQSKAEKTQSNLKEVWNDILSDEVKNEPAN